MTKLTVAALLIALSGSMHNANAEVSLVARASVPGSMLEKIARNGRPAINTATDPTGMKHRFGSWGSAIDWVSDDLYIVCNDRGPMDGQMDYEDRFHLIRIRLDSSSKEAGIDLVQTEYLVHGDKPFVGQLSAIGTDEAGKVIDPDMPTPRLDPEGVRITGSGTFFTSDEYGPFIDEFSLSGLHRRRIEVPEKFRVLKPSGIPELEMPPTCTAGRQPNRGLEGLAISPDGTTLTAILQSPLIQDGALNEKGRRKGLNIRLLSLTLPAAPEEAQSAAMRVQKPESTREYVYTLEKPANGVNEILAVDATRFLVLERDGKAGSETQSRAIYLIDTKEATDVSGIAALPTEALATTGETKPVTKKLFLDLLDPKHGLTGANMPEKIEGMTFGQTLEDGRRTLVVTTDNDLQSEKASQVWVFAFSDADLPGVEIGKKPGELGLPTEPEPSKEMFEPKVMEP